MKRLIAVAALAALTVPGCAEARTRLSGAGASFPSKIYQRWFADFAKEGGHRVNYCLLYTSPSPRDPKTSRMPSSA